MTLNAWPFRELRRGLQAAGCRTLLLLLAVGTVAVGHAQTAKDFNACDLLTVDEASTLLGAAAVPEAIKGKPPKIVPNCVYTSTVDGMPMALAIGFRFFKAPADALAALREARLEGRGRPLIISGQDAYWHPKLAHLVVNKGAMILTITAGPPKENERAPELARKVAERILPKLG